MPMKEQEYLSQRVDDQIKWYEEKSQSNQSWYKRLKLIELVASVTIPFFTGLIGSNYGSSKTLIILVGVLGIVIALIEGALHLYKYQENWIEYRKSAEFFRREKLLYLTGAAHYKDNPNKLQTLVERIETYGQNENQSWSEYIVQQVTNEEES